MFDFLSPFHIIFTGIVLQALPFLLLGALLSSALRVFVSDTVLIKLFPKKYGIGFATALFGGFFFPICECAAVPLMRSLIKKGVDMPIAVTFMLASPLINPISILSTLYAFPQQPTVALFRVFFGLLIALGIGLILLFYPKEKYLRDDFDAAQTAELQNKKSYSLSRLRYYEESAANSALFPSTGGSSTLQTVMNIAAAGRSASGNLNTKATEVSHTAANPAESSLTAMETRADSPTAPTHKQAAQRRLAAKAYALLMHTCSEFFTAGPFLIIGACITALIRTIVPQSFFAMASANTGTSLLLMMLFAFVFSACSTSDALIVRSFSARFPFTAILGFLVYGPMMDIKNLAMLLTLFKKRFVIELTAIITVSNFIGISLLAYAFL